MQERISFAAAALGVILSAQAGCDRSSIGRRPTSGAAALCAPGCASFQWSCFADAADAWLLRNVFAPFVTKLYPDGPPIDRVAAALSAVSMPGAP
jgi:hypothetical protein